MTTILLTNEFIAADKLIRTRHSDQLSTFKMGCKLFSTPTAVWAVAGNVPNQDTVNIINVLCDVTNLALDMGFTLLGNETLERKLSDANIKLSFDAMITMLKTSCGEIYVAANHYNYMIEIDEKYTIMHPVTDFLVAGTGSAPITTALKLGATLDEAFKLTSMADSFSSKEYDIKHSKDLKGI